jgi:hypothetical protein
VIYEVGDAVTVSTLVHDSAGALTDATMAILVTKPDLTTTAPSINHAGTGSYNAVVTTDAAGLWRYKFTASGAVVAVDDGQFTVVAPGRVLVASFEEFKARINRSDITDDAELRSYLHSATDWTEYAIGGPLSVQTFTEIHWVCGDIVPRKRPIVAITSITPDQGTAISSSSYFADPGTQTIHFRYGVYPNWHTLIYTAGLSVIPERAKIAGLEVASHLWSVQNGSSGRGFPTDDLVPTPMGFAVPRRAAELLAPDRIPGVG